MAITWCNNGFVGSRWGSEACEGLSGAESRNAFVNIDIAVVEGRVSSTESKKGAESGEKRAM